MSNMYRPMRLKIFIPAMMLFPAAFRCLFADVLVFHVVSDLVAYHLFLRCLGLLCGDFAVLFSFWRLGRRPM